MLLFCKKEGLPSGSTNLPATRFHLIRHASTDAVGRVLSGRTPIPLNAQGQAEAARLAESLASTAAHAIFSSPQARALQTAQAIGQVLGLPPQPDAALDEVDFGAWTGQAFSTLDGRPDWTLWNTHRSLAPPPGRETMLDVQARAAAMLVRLHAERPGGSFILVSHADVLRSVLAWALGLPVDLMQRLEVSPASRSLLVLGEAGARVECLNLPPWGGSREDQTSFPQR